MPRERAVDALSPEIRAARGRGAGAATVLAGGTADLTLDAGEDARLWVEEPLLHLRPAAEAELLDREQAGPRRELLRELGRNGLAHGPVAVLGEDALRVGRAQVAQERRRLGLVLALPRDGDRVLDQDRRARDPELEVLALRLREQRLVLVGEHHVALAAR